MPGRIAVTRAGTDAIARTMPQVAQDAHALQAELEQLVARERR